MFSARLGDAKSKNPDDKLTGVFVLATSYSRTACRRTTIGAAAFHFRVRNGNGWGHCARVTRVRCRTSGVAASQRASRYRALETMSILERTYQLSTISCCRSADIYIQEFISAEDSRRYNRASFCFEIICSSLQAFAVLSHGEGLTEK